MNCPRCERPTLIEIDRDGITIDRCDECRGIWLDRGELEKLLARRGRDGDDDRDRDDDDDDDRRPGRRRDRGSWFDFFD